MAAIRRGLEELIKEKQENVPKTLSANLANIYQFRLSFYKYNFRL